MKSWVWCTHSTFLVLLLIYPCITKIICMCPEDRNSKVDEVAKSFRENKGPGKNRPKQELNLICREITRVSKGKDAPQKPYIWECVLLCREITMKISRF